MVTSTRDARLRLLSLLLATVPLGFGLKFWRGPGAEWVANYAAGVVYEVFWILAFALVWPARRHLPWIAAGVFLITSAFEVLQLWHPPLLEAARATFVGRAVLGSTFSWWDFPHYGVGCLLGYAAARWAVGWHGSQAAE